MPPPGQNKEKERKVRNDDQVRYGTELTFVFEIGGASVEKKTTLIEE